MTTELRIRWLGHSAFLVSAEHTVLLDPFAIPKDPSLQSRGMVFDYPPIDKVAADLVLISHEHFDHNGSEVVEGSPQVIRSTAGKFDSCIGSIVAIAGEHDDVAGTKRGLNTIFCFSLGDTRLCHLGDFGQARLRPEQERAIGEIDILFLSIGGGPTLGPEAAVALMRTPRPRLALPMHYRTLALNFLEPPGVFLEAVVADLKRLETSEVAVEELLGTRELPVVALLAPPAS